MPWGVVVHPQNMDKKTYIYDIQYLHYYKIVGDGDDRGCPSKMRCHFPVGYMNTVGSGWDGSNYCAAEVADLGN